MRRREFVTALGTVAATWLSPGLSGAQGIYSRNWYPCRHDGN
jgi:hypothetical protein